MPRVAAVTIPTIFEVVKRYPIFDDITSNLKTETELVWTHIIKENEESLKNLKKHNLHQKIYYNTKNIQSDLKKYQHIRSAKKKIVKKTPVTHQEILSQFLEIKFSEKYSNSLHQVTASPFSLFYWLPEQKNLARELALYTEFSACLFIVQNIIQEVTVGERLSNSLFFLILSTSYENQVYPLYQTVTEEANENCFIKKFLRETLKNQLPVSANISVPFLFVHANCASLVFNKSQLSEYLENVFL